MSNPPPNVPGDQQGGEGAWGGWPPPPPPGPSLPPFGRYGGPQSNVTAPVPASLAEWPQRALGWLIDLICYLVPWLILYILTLASNSDVFEVVGSFVYLGLAIWFASQLGHYGSTPGMRVIGLRCVSLSTGQPIGAGMGIVRYLCHAVAGLLFYIPYIVDMLFPLWDPRKQTLADKIVSSVVITVPKQPFSLVPRGY